MNEPVRMMSVGDVLAVVISPPAAVALYGLVRQIYSQHLYRGFAPSSEAECLLEVLETLSKVPTSASGQSVVSREGGASEFVSTAMAARLLEIHPRTVRRRATQGQIPGAERQGRDWRIPLKYLEH